MKDAVHLDWQERVAALNRKATASRERRTLSAEFLAKNQPSELLNEWLSEMLNARAEQARAEAKEEARREFEQKHAQDVEHLRAQLLASGEAKHFALDILRDSRGLIRAVDAHMGDETVRLEVLRNSAGKIREIKRHGKA